MAQEVLTNIQKPLSREAQRPFRLTKKHIHRFIAQATEAGKSESTIRKYRADLNRFYDFLNDDKWIYPDSLPRWRQYLIDCGYAGRSVNSSVVAVNCLYEFLGCWEWKVFDWEKLSQPEGPELTRQEYLQLLAEARRQEDIQLYLLVKILAQTELTPSDIAALTREVVEEGTVELTKRGESKAILLPEDLCGELRDFCVYRNIRSGPIFLSSGQKVLDRTVVSRMIATLGADIGLENGKANPRNLRRLYLNTLALFQRQADAWVKERYACLIRQEEDTIGWHR